MKMNKCFVAGLMAFTLTSTSCGIIKKDKKKNEDKSTEEVKKEDDKSIPLEVEEVIVKKGHEVAGAINNSTVQVINKDDKATNSTTTVGGETNAEETVVVVEEKLDVKFGDIKEFSLDLISDKNSTNLKTILISMQDEEEELQHFGSQFKANEIASAIINIKDTIYGYNLEANIQCIGDSESRACDILAVESKMLNTESKSFDQTGSILTRIGDTAKFETIAIFQLSAKNEGEATTSDAVIKNLESFYGNFLIQQLPVAPVAQPDEIVLDECGLEASKQSGVKICYFTVNSDNTKKGAVLKNYDREKVKLGHEIVKKGDKREKYLGNYSIEANGTLAISGFEFSLNSSDTLNLILQRSKIDSCSGVKEENGKVQCGKR